MVLYGFLEVSKIVIGVAKITYAFPSPALSLSSLEIWICLSRCFLAFLKSPTLW